jgi:hypothetical protein
MRLGEAAKENAALGLRGVALGEEKGEHDDREHASSEVTEEEGHAGYSCSPEIGNGAGGNTFGRFDPVMISSCRTKEALRFLSRGYPLDLLALALVSDGKVA